MFHILECMQDLGPVLLLSLRAAMPLAEILATCRKKVSNTGPGLCLTTATWRCRKNFIQWECSFHWKLHCHWLEFLRQRQIAVVRQGPASLHLEDDVLHLTLQLDDEVRGSLSGRWVFMTYWKKYTWGPFYQHGLTLIPAWISDYIHYKVWDEITYQFLNFNDETVEV